MITKSKILKKDFWQIKDIDKKLTDTTGLVKKTKCNTKCLKIESIIPNMTCLVTHFALQYNYAG